MKKGYNLKKQKLHSRKIIAMLDGSQLKKENESHYQDKCALHKISQKNINKSQKNSSCSVCGERYEALIFLIFKCSNLVGIKYKTF